MPPWFQSGQRRTLCVVLSADEPVEILNLRHIPSPKHPDLYNLGR